MRIFLFWLVAMLTGLAPANWAGFRGGGDSRTAARQLPLQWSATDNVAWRAELLAYGQSSPVVWGDRVYLTSVQGANKEKLWLFCHDFKTGRQLWQRESAATFTQKDADIVSKAAPTPAVDEKGVYVFFESGDLFGFNHGGKLLWQRKLAGEYGGYKTNHGLGSSLAQTEKAIYVLVAHDGPSYLLAVNKRDGKNLWKTELKSGGGWSTPLVHQAPGQPMELLVSIAGAITAYDAATGASRWQVNGLKGNNIPSPSVGDNLVVAGSSEKGMSLAVRLGGAGDVTASHVAWRAEEATANFASPLIHRGRVYFVNKVGVAFCLDLKTGREIWRERIGGECWTSPLAAGDRIYFFTNAGYTVVIRPGDQFQQLAKNMLPEVERIYGVAALDDALLLRSGRKLIKLANR
ncbi:MAG: PQQ-binding-like beta-propeller repeat protein [Blastocatellia bacterium]|nr:PQQ-binding-like beta-propeller repeat protein [Blastocatellia bacterium]